MPERGIFDEAFLGLVEQRTLELLRPFEQPEPTEPASVAPPLTLKPERYQPPPESVQGVNRVLGLARDVARFALSNRIIFDVNFYMRDIPRRRLVFSAWQICSFKINERHKGGGYSEWAPNSGG